MLFCFRTVLAVVSTDVCLEVLIGVKYDVQKQTANIDTVDSFGFRETCNGYW